MGSRKQGAETNRQVLGIIKAYQAISTTEIAKILHRPEASVREACRRLEARGYLQKERIDIPTGRKALWSLSTGPVDDTKHHRSRMAPERDDWRPQPWRHPYNRPTAPRPLAIGAWPSDPTTMRYPVYPPKRTPPKVDTVLEIVLPEVPDAEA